MKELNFNLEGVLAFEDLIGITEKGYANNVDLKNIGPASIDLRVSDRIYEVSGVFMPYRESNAYEAYKRRGLIKKQIDIDSVLEQHKIYLVKLQEELALPDYLRALSSPKSSIGRVDLHVRILNSYMGRFDTLHYGYTGELWALVMPKTFKIKLSPNVTITQLRFLSGDARIRDYRSLLEFLQTHQVIYSRRHGRPFEIKDLTYTDYDNTLILTLDIAQNIVAWRGKDVDKVLDLSAENSTYDPFDFFEPIYNKDILRNDEYILPVKANTFYILSTAQRIKVPLGWATEFVSVDTYTGEFRGHYAGFVDPGWGISEKAGKQLTLELRAFEDMYLKHNQPIIKLAWDKLLEPTTVNYDKREFSNYIEQHGPRLAKWFKKP